MSSPLVERVRMIAADVLQLPLDQVTARSSTENSEKWDSVNHLNLILAYEQEFGIQFEPAEIDKMTSIERIIEILQSRLK
jgi:acyl carrier protein